MSEKIPSNQPQPIVKIGHYTLGQTLGVGTFGKVKSMWVIANLNRRSCRYLVTDNLKYT